jgi:hypothetical protein
VILDQIDDSVSQFLNWVRRLMLGLPILPFPRVQWDAGEGLCALLDR